MVENSLTSYNIFGWKRRKLTSKIIDSEASDHIIRSTITSQNFTHCRYESHAIHKVDGRNGHGQSTQPIGFGEPEPN